MAIFKNGNLPQAFDGIKPYSVIEDYKIDTIANKTSQLMLGLSNSVESLRAEYSLRL